MEPNKKTTKKKAVKRKTARTTTKIKTENKLLKDAPREQYFILCDGQPIRNVGHLAEKLEELSHEVFDHHVTPDRNDFANWVNDIFQDVELAKEIAGLKNKEHVRLAIYKHIVKKL